MSISLIISIVGLSIASLTLIIVLIKSLDIDFEYFKLILYAIYYVLIGVWLETLIEKIKLYFKHKRDNK